MTELRSIATKYPINMGAPSPKVICDEINLTLLHYVDLFELPDTTDKIKERDTNVDTGVAIVRFTNTYIHKFGIPNDEVIIGHPYYDIGLKPYSFFSVEDSDWIKEIKRIQSHHPYFDEDRYKDVNHYILTFKDNTFECVATDFSIEYSFDSMNQVFQNLVIAGQ
ncbi:hypothetical protein FGF1_41020 [Flavobacteriaceae bacterium GF1]